MPAFASRSIGTRSTQGLRVGPLKPRRDTMGSDGAGWSRPEVGLLPMTTEVATAAWPLEVDLATPPDPIIDVLRRITRVISESLELREVFSRVAEAAAGPRGRGAVADASSQAASGGPCWEAHRRGRGALAPSHEKTRRPARSRAKERRGPRDRWPGSGRDGRLLAGLAPSSRLPGAYAGGDANTPSVRPGRREVATLRQGDSEETVSVRSAF